MATKTERPERATLTVAETAELLGIALGTAYRGVRSGALPAVRVGGRYLVPREALSRLLAGEGDAHRPETALK